MGSVQERQVTLMDPTSSEENTSFRSRCKQLLPTKQNVFLLIIHGLIILFVIATFYGVLGNDVLPGSEIFALFLLYVASYIAGQIVKCFWLPPLFGMLIAGFLYRNLPFIPYYSDISVRWASTLRGSALVIILLKAGLGLDAQKLKELKGIVLLLGFVPCIVEAVTVIFASHFLIQLPWLWAVLLGFIISAVSPAVVIPSLLSLQEKGYGTRKGVPTLVIAAASVDNILVITGFTVMLSITLTKGSWLWSLDKGVLEPIIGLVFGVGFGYMFWHIPKDLSKPMLSFYRVILLCSGGLAVMFLSKSLEYAGVGPFGCLVFGFVAALGWKKDPETFSNIEQCISSLWKAVQPFLFSLIGSEVTIDNLEKNIGNSVLLLSIGILLRICATVVTFKGDFNWKEKMFIAFAWLPKATVQAVLGPQALDFILIHDKGPELEDLAKKVLSVAVLSILMTAPIGAILIAILGPILLTHEGRDDIEEQNIIEEASEEYDNQPAVY